MTSLYALIEQVEQFRSIHQQDKVGQQVDCLKLSDPSVLSINYKGKYPGSRMRVGPTRLQCNIVPLANNSRLIDNLRTGLIRDPVG